MNRAFTLVELLVVMAIIGLLGTVSVGGYRAMQRGMEERGVMESVNSLVRAAYQRAQIDRQPTVVCFWNETLREADDENNEIVVGRAVAVRRHGRLSDVRNGGELLVDEFGDLNLSYRTEAGDDEEDAGGQTESKINLYPIEKLSDVASSSALMRSIVMGNVVNASTMPQFLTGSKDDRTSDKKVLAYAFRVYEKGGVAWKPGMAYGFEFMELQLPKNYIFGRNYKKSVSDPVQAAGTLVFAVGVNSGNGRTRGGTVGRNSVSVCSLRPEGATLKVEEVAQSDDPEKGL